MAQTKVFSIAGKGLKFNTKEDIQKYLDELTPIAELEEIILSGNSFGIDASEALADILKTKKTLKVVNMSDIFTGRLRSEIPKCLTAFTNALIDKKLEVLDLSDNAFGPDGLNPVVPLISAVVSLKVLKVNNTGLGPQGGQILAGALMGAHKKNVAEGKESSLRTLVCGRSRLENGSMDALAEALKSHYNLQEVVLPQDGIRPEGIVKLASGLAGCPKLEIIDLQDNTFTDMGAKAFASALSSWPNLKRLNVGDCMLTAKGARCVFDAFNSAEFTAAPKLEVLNLQYNEIDEKTILFFATVLNKFNALKTLELNGNCFSEDGAGADAVKNALEKMGKEEVLGSLSDMEEDEDDDDIEDDESDADEIAQELAEM